MSLLKCQYPEESLTFQILFAHSMAVAKKARHIALKMNDPRVQPAFVYEASLLHDIGIKFTQAEEFGCTGGLPYICHGYLGHDLLVSLGLPRHALVCERHTGTGLTLSDIINNKLPLPMRPLMPVSLEEQLIAYCDKFFSKTGDTGKEKSVEDISKSLMKYGEDKARQFVEWHERFAGYK